MERQNDSGTLAYVELLGVGEGMLTDPDRSFHQPIVLLTVRPEPEKSWQAFTLAVNRRQAKRLRDDLTALLEESQSATHSN
ncbi:MAG: hypothetical protein H8E44_11900 [Planctomycetes bacterium]|nr:hypothetical protein [Planctomycetota bacterium]MBL7038230.1 hypothetical protein [Pirellulaceae bacterium]